MERATRKNPSDGCLMRVAAWNCRQGVDRKINAITRLEADVVVVPECAASPRLAREPGVSFEWLGTYAPKGLGVFGFNGWTVARLEEETDPWCLPLRVESPSAATSFTLLAVWTVTPRQGVPSYAEQFARTIDQWADSLADESVAIAGDLNASMQGPSERAHRSNLDRLKELGTDSAYHSHYASAHGAEEAMTLRWIGRGGAARYYHCDFVFLSNALQPFLAGAQVGSVSDWIEAGLSDHCPVIVDLALAERAPGFQGVAHDPESGL